MRHQHACPTLEERVKVANKFLEENRDYSFAKFHTHTEETCRINPRNGYYFSKGDKEEMDRQLRDDPWFVEFLFTPYSLSAYGNPVLRVSIRETNRDDIRRDEDLSNRIDSIANELGISLDNLICHKRRDR